MGWSHRVRGCFKPRQLTRVCCGFRTSCVAPTGNRSLVAAGICLIGSVASAQSWRSKEATPGCRSYTGGQHLSPEGRRSLARLPGYLDEPKDASAGRNQWNCFTRPAGSSSRMSTRPTKGRALGRRGRLQSESVRLPAIDPDEWAEVRCEPHAEFHLVGYRAALAKIKQGWGSCGRCASGLVQRRNRCDALVGWSGLDGQGAATSACAEQPGGVRRSNSG